MGSHQPPPSSLAQLKQIQLEQRKKILFEADRDFWKTFGNNAFIAAAAGATAQVFYLYAHRADLWTTPAKVDATYCHGVKPMFYSWGFNCVISKAVDVTAHDTFWSIIGLVTIMVCAWFTARESTFLLELSSKNYAIPLTWRNKQFWLNAWTKHKPWRRID